MLFSLCGGHLSFVFFLNIKTIIFFFVFNPFFFTHNCQKKKKQMPAKRKPLDVVDCEHIQVNLAQITLEDSSGRALKVPDALPEGESMCRAIWNFNLPNWLPLFETYENFKAQLQICITRKHKGGTQTVVIKLPE